MTVGYELKAAREPVGGAFAPLAPVSTSFRTRSTAAWGRETELRCDTVTRLGTA